MRLPRLAAVVLLCLVWAVGASARDTASPTVRVKNLRVLVAIYRGAEGDKDRLTDADLAGIRAGIALGRMFYFRNTRGLLNLEFTERVIDARAPKNDGPTMEFMEGDLRARGVRDNEFDGCFVTGVGLTGNWGGFQILGKTGACFGIPDRRGGLSWYPEDDPGTWYGAAWTFVHEFQHALDGPICGPTHPEMLSGHPYSDSMESYFHWGHQGAQHWSWEAHTLRDFGPRILQVDGVCRSWIEAKDSDGDGLADDDPRLPMDEKRFGSDPNLRDTDGDGLDDLGEFTAGIYWGSDPRSTDTDGDGLPDGRDPYPDIPIASTISYAREDSTVDGRVDRAYRALLPRPVRCGAPELSKAELLACWNEDALYLLLRNAPEASLYLEIDTSADNGYWEGGDTYIIEAGKAEGVVFAGLGLSGPVPGASATAGTDGLEIRIPALIGQGVSNEINWGGKRRPEDVTDGLQLWAGRRIAVNAAAYTSASRALFTPNWAMYATELRKAPSDPPRPSLRSTPALTRLAEPTAVVRGVGPRDRVVVETADGAVVGRRVGPGKLTLSGALHRGSTAAAGRNTLVASVGDRRSAPYEVVVDTGADAPRVEVRGNQLAVEGEPGAVVEVLAEGGSGGPQSVGAVSLDASGRGTWALPESFAGFLGAYSADAVFGPPLFRRIDPKIEFDYQDRSCDPRIPADGFSIAWSGTLDVPRDGDYTFYLSTDDGSRLFVDGAQVIDNWGHHGVTEKTAKLTLKAGTHALRVLYYEDYGWAAAHLEWSGPGIARTHDLPVRALPMERAEARWSARQTDAAGNVSPFSTPVP